MNKDEFNISSFIEEYTWLFGILLFLVLVDAVLKIITLWKSARRKQLVWFIFLALVNSLGILPIIYLIINRNKEEFKR
ncbi:DUF5652 family protein [Psychroflexus aestuariivivens]|uniref:DUF5652 family protein n=1 Tax=Psychroflexus aestuariivivens TaxID=1795040 RepID=UPI000FDCA57F|nr:DUF5652 family protein [Psychroflexus aestuariivivens]